MTAWSRRRRPPSKHVSYFDLLEAAGLEGCPVCRLARRTADRFLDILSYENVNDIEIRAHLRASRGFCNLHAWQFVDDVDDGLGTAIIYRDIVDNVLRLAEHPQAASGRSRLRFVVESALGRGGADLAERIAPQGECLACQQLHGSAGRYVETLLAHLAAEDLRVKYAEGDGLCLPHLRQALRRARTDGEVALLVEPTARRLFALAATDTVDPAPLAALLAGDAGAVPQAVVESTAGFSERHAATPPADWPSVSGEAQCPLCAGARAASDAVLVALTGQGEPGHAGADADAGVDGLCNRHTWRLLELVEGRVAAGLLRPLAGETARLLGAEGEAPAAGRSAGPLAFWEQRSRGSGEKGTLASARAQACPACRVEAGAERGLVEQSSPRVDAAIPGGALCLGHLALALRLTADGGKRGVLVADLKDSYHRLTADLSEFIRKRDYRFVHEPPGAEAGSPERAVARVAGARELRILGRLAPQPEPGATGQD